MFILLALLANAISSKSAYDLAMNAPSTRQSLALFLAIVVMSSIAASVPASAAESPTKVTVVSPAPGTVINPDLPFVITLALTGGGAEKANRCFDWNNRNALGDFQFGAQAIDVNNFGKSLTWGGDGSVFGTGGELYEWSAKVIPGGIQCTLGVNQQYGSARFAGRFSLVRDQLANPVDTRNTEWFGTKSSEDLSSETAFGKYSAVDLAWSINGKVSKVRFSSSNKGMPEVKIVGLQRGQTIDYEASFQIVGILSSKLELDSMYVAVDGRGDRDWAQCGDFSEIRKSDNNDGTFTYTNNCFISFQDTNFTDDSIEVVPVIRTTLSGYEGTDGEIVVINIGKQGTPPCSSAIDNLTTTFGKYQQILSTSQSKFALTTTGDAAKQIFANLNSLQMQISQTQSSARALAIEVNSCQEGKSALDQNLSALSKVTSDLMATVKKFAESPGLQAKARAEAKARAKKQAAEQAAYAKSLYAYGFNFVAKMSVSQLSSLGIWKFPSPGKSSLNDAQARDWCSQLPRVVVGLPNIVGYPANPNYIAGCADAAKKIRF